MTNQQTRETMQAYAAALLSFGDIRPHLSDDVTMAFMGTNRIVTDRKSVVLGKECRSRCDWSSDVCSSDLNHAGLRRGASLVRRHPPASLGRRDDGVHGDESYRDRSEERRVRERV